MGAYTHPYHVLLVCNIILIKVILLVMAPTLGYWKIRGLAEPIRYLLHHTGTDFTDQRFELTGSAPNFSREQWTSVKETLGLQFPNLPYYIDGDLKISESGAILRHLARKNNLAGNTEEEYIKIDVANGLPFDIGMGLAMLSYNPNFASMKDAFVAEVPAKMEKLAKLIGDNKFLLGDKVCYVDFCIFELLERYTALVPSCLTGHANLIAFHSHVASLPAIAKYRSSPSFLEIKERYNNKIAAFGSGV